jgi:hypothetical protein
MNPADRYLQACFSQLGLTPLPTPTAPLVVETVLALPWLTEPIETLYLPVVWTAQGPLYGELIAQLGAFYIQPWDIPDRTRQVLYDFAFQSLEGHRSWGVYLLTFKQVADNFAFKGFTPMPHPAALVSTLCQQPHLFLAHIYSLYALPVIDLQIQHPAAVWIGATEPARALLWPGVTWYPDWLGCTVYPPPMDREDHPFASVHNLLG